MKRIAQFRQFLQTRCLGLIGLGLFALGTIPTNVLAVEIQQVTSPSGIKAYLVENYTSPIITLSFSFAAGATQDPEGKEGATRLLSTMLDEGAGDIDGPKFQAMSEELGMEVGFRAARDNFSGTMQTLVENSAQSFDLLRLALNEPRFDVQSIQRMRHAIVKGLERAKTNPRSIASIAMRNALFKGHPYARATNGTVESVGALTRDDLQNIYRRLVVKEGLIIGVVGAIDKQQLGKVIDEVFSPLPENSELELVQDAKPHFGTIIRKNANITQSIVSFALPGLKRSHPDFFAAFLTNHILGGGTFSSRLYDEIREKRGLAYSVSSHMVSYSHAAFTMVGSATATKTEDEAINIIRAELTRMAENGPSEQELQAAKKYIIGSYAIRNLDTSTKVASVLVAIQQAGLGIDYIDRRQQIINSITLQDAKRAAAKLLKQEPTMVVVGPAKS